MTTTNPALPSDAQFNFFSLLLSKFVLLIAFACISGLSHAQQQQRAFVDFRKEKQEYRGFTIRPIPSISGAYGYDILKDHKLLLHQYQDPVPGIRLNTKEEVYKVAQWAIAQYTTINHFPDVVPPAIIKKLQLSPTHW